MTIHTTTHEDTPPAAHRDTVLDAHGVTMRFGGLTAVRSVDLTLHGGEIVGLIGPDGAGKTTTPRTLSGLIKPAGGHITFNGKPLRKHRADQIVKLGLAHSPEGRHIFPRMTVEDNLRLGAHLRDDTEEINHGIRHTHQLLPILEERRKQAAGTFSGGEQQMLAMGHALMSRPALLMLDEPSMGLSPIMMQKIMTTIAGLKCRGTTTILLVEQNAHAALSLTDHGHVMEVGRIVHSGPGSELLHDASVRKAYLGED